ncbi:MAG: hypothetical protein KIT31_42740 [Deltaproteobacteria bacterium]|nr:hypothetical protein [Deltaproteobacteria bacterium]
MIKTSTSALLALATVASAAHADDAAPAPSLPLIVRASGGLDAEALRARISAELGAPIALVAACSAPCLDVRIADGRATVAYLPAHGSPRARTVELGRDGAQWTLVVTLLAGNVVRDEVNDILATLPAPVGPAPAPPSPPPDEAVAEEAEPPPPPVEMLPEVATSVPPPPDPELRTRSMFLGFGFVPGLSTDGLGVGNVRHFLSLDLIAGVSGGSSGVTVSGLVDVERGPVHGLQVAGIASLARSVDGVQIAGVAAVAGDADAVQVAGVTAVARRAGSQFAGVAAVSYRSAATQAAGVAVHARSSEIQVAGVAANTTDDAAIQLAGVAVHAGRARFQAAGVASVSDSRAELQLAGVTSVARTASVQLAGVVNVADRVTGVQIAPINVARRVSGVQLGVLNVGGDAGGSSFGLINIVPGGRYDLEGAIDSSNTTSLLFRHGGNGWHNVYGIAGHPVDERGPTDDVWMYGLGFGPSWKLSTSRIDAEAIAWQVNHGTRHSTDVSLLAQARLSIAYGLGPVSLVAGAAYNVYISNDQASPLILERRTPGGEMTTGDVTVTRWPTAFVGVRL